jgi:hypothetical protein
MQERSSIMGVADMPSLRNLETDIVTKSLQILPSQKRRQSALTSDAYETPLTLHRDSMQPIPPTAYPETVSIMGTSYNGSSSTITPHIPRTAPSGNNNSQTTKSHSFNDHKHDTRIVNEAFQDAVVLLEEGFNSKMQAEMLVLVDVLHKPAAIFQSNSNFRQYGQDKRFIAK